jgi:erythromycin esterase-like protein
MSRDDALTAATRDMCGKDVVLLGEASHGDGATEAFKVALVQRLVTSCRFNAVFFEASHYDFLEISRRLREGEAVTPEMVSSAVGWMWSHDAEFAPLIPFLHAEAAAGRITLGGLDDQLGVRDEFYSLGTMQDELASYLGDGERAECRKLLDEPTDRARFQQCVADIGRIVAARADLEPERREEIAELLSNVLRTNTRDTRDRNKFITDRDRSMWLNLQWLATRLPPASKIIIWTATAHAAKDGSLDPAYATAPNLGRYVAQAYGSRAFALGFTAASGAYASTRTEARRIPAPPQDSLEARALAAQSGAAVYVGPAELRAMGRASAALSFYQYRTVDLADVVDGVVVFQAEYPPTLVDGR